MTDRERSRSPEPALTAPAAQDDSAVAYNGGGGGQGGGGQETGEEVKLYVGNLDYATDEKKLRDEFGQFGVVTDVFLPVERGTSRPRGFGFVTMSNRSESVNAINKMLCFNRTDWPIHFLQQTTEASLSGRDLLLKKCSSRTWQTRSMRQ
jgi:hypothetical protein